jgi:hypothetical protein
MADIVRSFDAALGTAGAELVTWAVTNPALSTRRGSVKSWTRFVHARGEVGQGELAPAPK